MIKSLLNTCLICCSLLTCCAVAQEHTIDIKKFKFTPQQLTIKVGDTVIWLNIEKRQYHNVWFKQLFEQEPEIIFPGENYQLSFDKPGTYPYSCGPHPKMTGTIVVK